MKLLLENWREYLQEDEDSLTKFVEYLKEKYALNALTLYDREPTPWHPINALHLSNIRVSPDSRGQNTGTQAMEEIIKYADDNASTITLIPIPEDEDEGNVHRLRSWYEKFGFEDWYREDEEEDFEREYTKYMIRHPKESA